MNELFLRLGVPYLKPLATALVLPPLPFILIAMVGLFSIRRRPRVGLVFGMAGLVLLWLSGCVGAAQWAAPLLLRLPPTLTSGRMADLRREDPHTGAVIVLGAGVQPMAPEYGTSSLQFHSLERLRYGLWLAGRIGWPVGFSGGLGWGQPTTEAQVAEATVAERIAREEFGRPLRWVEATSRDTRENALNTVAILRTSGVHHVVVVTNVWHMPRAVRNFERAAGSYPLRIEAAPIGFTADTEMRWMRWIPTGSGFELFSAVCREWLGWFSGA